MSGMINFTQHYNDAHHHFGSGYADVHFNGHVTSYNGMLNTEPRFHNRAEVWIGSNLPSREERRTMRMTAGEMRSLADYLMGAADALDRGVSLPFKPSKLLTIGESGDTYFTGDLDAGKALAKRDRFAKVEKYGEQFSVALCDDPDGKDNMAEWGSGVTEDEAWRYALGAMFGPIDYEYDEERLYEALRAEAEALRDEAEGQ